MRLNAVILILGLCFTADAFAAEKPAAQLPAGTTTEHTFEDVLVQGKFEFSDEAVTTVEEDKVLDSLIGVRTDFKDRLEQSAERF